MAFLIVMAKTKDDTFFAVAAAGAAVVSSSPSYIVVIVHNVIIVFQKPIILAIFLCSKVIKFYAIYKPSENARGGEQQREG